MQEGQNFDADIIISDIENYCDDYGFDSTMRLLAVTMGYIVKKNNMEGAVFNLKGTIKVDITIDTKKYDALLKQHRLKNNGKPHLTLVS